MTGRSFLFLLASARRDGNSETLAQRAADALPETTARRWLRLNELSLPPFEDLRHAGVPFPVPAGDERVLFDATVAASDIVFVAPLYWYSLPASAKLYLDYWSSWLRYKEGNFKARMAGKRLWGMVTLSVCRCVIASNASVRTGSIFGVQARFMREHVKIEGRATQYMRVGDSGGRVVFSFCPTCGSTVYWQLEGQPDRIAVAVGAFADPTFPAPKISVYEERRHPWAVMPALKVEHE